MFLPIVNYADGYGFTYGGRVSTIDLLGIGERLSVPLTWGGTRRAALEVERTFKTGPLTRVAVDVRHLAAREPALRDRRSARRAGRPRRAELRRRRPHRRRRRRSSTVDFGDARRSPVDARRRRRARHARRSGLSRATPSCSSAGWTGLHVARPRRAASTATRPTRAAISASSARPSLAGRVQYRRRTARCPDYERLLLGGAVNAARLPHRHVRRRSDARDVRGGARADHLGAERREAGRDGVRRRRQGLGRRPVG